MKRAGSALALALLLAACTTAGQHPPLETVAQVDIARYAGTWHEIALYPNRFQQACAADTTATYTPLGEGRIGVRNSCRR
ncbi:MAG: lipocalin family protein, partial [Burkholderiales bacterium]